MIANRFNTLWTGVALSFVALALNTGGCIVDIATIPPPSGGGGGGGGGQATTVTIRVINETGATIDPQFFVSATAIGAASELFAAGNAFTRFGVGNRGLLGDFDSDTLIFACEDALAIGTQGGLFGDDLENPNGRGQQRFLSQGESFECGETITLRFARSGGDFVTTVSIMR